MLKSKKFALIILTLAIVFATICLFVVLFVSANKNSNLTDAEISDKVQEEPTDTTIVVKEATGYEVHDDASSYTGGISIHNNKAWCKVYIRYDTTYISSVSISNVDAWADYNSRGYHWDDAVFSLNPQSGFSWAVDSFSFYVKRSSSDAAYDDPVNTTSSDEWDSDASSNQSFSRSGNQFWNDGWSDSGSGLNGSIQQIFYINTVGNGLFNNGWAETPWVQGCDYGGTITWGGSALYGSTSVTWYNSSYASLSRIPTLPGTYYARVYSSGSGNVRAIYSDYMQFTITGTVTYTDVSSDLGKGHGKVYIEYDSAYISACTISNVSVTKGGFLNIYTYTKWDPSVFSLTPANGLTWSASSYSINVKIDSSQTAYEQPSSYTGSWDSDTAYDFSRSSNTFTSATAVIDVQARNIIQNSYRVAFIRLTDMRMFNNTWAVNPSIASWTYGETASEPLGTATYSGTTTYTYYDVNQTQLSGKPTTPGTYYMRCSDTGKDMVNAITSDLIQFKIYAPTPSVSPINQMWTGSQLSVTPTYDGTYMNAPSGTVGTNIGAYTATFTTKSGYVFNNNSTSYSITWNIKVRELTIPILGGEFTYDGQGKAPTIAYGTGDSSYITQGGTASATNAGTYAVTFTIKTPYTNGGTSGCVWSDGTNGQKSLNWTIARAAVAIKPTLKDSGSYTYTGSAVNINTHVNNFNTSYMTASNNSKTNAGNYTTTYTLNSNYAWTDGTTANATVSWAITPKPLTKPTRSANPTFTGSAVSPTLSNFDSNTMNKTGDTSATNVKTSGNYTITISLKDTTNYKWSDNTTASYTISWNVLPKDISGGTITITPTDYTYDGAEHKPTVTVTVP